MVEGAYQSSQGGVAPVPPGDTRGGGGHGAGDTSDGNLAADNVTAPVDGLRQRNAARGRDFAWADSKPSGQDLTPYAHEDRKMP